MLNILHSKINSIIPIQSIIDNNGTYDIEYIDSEIPTNEQLSQIQDILTSWPLDQIKLSKIELLNEKWGALINQGWETSYGWFLGLTNQDVTLLTGAFLLAKEAANLGVLDDTTIIDTDGLSHTISINDLTILMIQYGQYRSTLSAYYANKKNEIEQASTIEQVNNIIL
jgi:hypothetical protein